MKAVSSEEFVEAQKQKLRRIGYIRSFSQVVALCTILYALVMIALNIKTPSLLMILFGLAGQTAGLLLMCCVVYLLAEIGSELVLGRRR